MMILVSFLAKLWNFNLVHVSDEESGSAGSGESSEESGNDEEESENQSSSESQTDETVRGMGKPVN
jgi:hypothetical protein